MRILALDTYDDHQEGDVYECPDGQAAKLIAKGLARAWGEEPKQAPGPKENKNKPPHPNKGAAEITEAEAAAMLAKLPGADPSSAAGEVLPSSVSPAAQASPVTTPAPSSGGAPVAAPRRRGRPPGSGKGGSSSSTRRTR